VRTAFRFGLSILILLPLLCMGIHEPQPPVDLWSAQAGVPFPARIGALEAALQRPLAPDEEGLLRFALGAAHRRAGGEAAALAQFSHPTARATPVGEFAILWSARIREDLGDESGARKEWRALFEFSAAEPSFKALAAGILSDPAGAPPGSEAETRRCLAYLAGRPEADPETLDRLVRLCLAEGDRPEAVRWATLLWNRHPSSKETLALFKAHGDLEAEVASGAGADMLRRMRSLVRQKAWWRLGKELPSFRPEGPVEEAWRWFLRGRLSEAGGNPRTALRHYERVLESDCEAAPEALAGIERVLPRSGLSSKKQREWERAVAALDQGTFPAREKILVRRMRWRYKKGQRRLAAELAEEVLRGTPGERYACALLYDMAWEAWLKGDRLAPPAHLQRMVAGTREGQTFRQAALFSLMKMGFLEPSRVENARAELLKTSRYGYFGHRLRGGAPPASPAAPQPVVNPLPPAGVGTHRRKAELLMRIGLTEEALRETESAYGVEPHWHLAWQAARLRRKIQDYPSSIRMARKAFPGAWGEEGDRLPREVWEILYPVSWEKDLRAVSRTRSVPVETICAIIRQESLWDPFARSRAGAMGLMQLMPGTGRMMARRVGIGGSTRTMLHNPATNIRLGTAYYAEMLERYKGRADHAMAAYNAGPGRVDAWLKRKGNPGDPELFI